MEGWLQKRPHAQGGRWERRLCTLRSSQLHYFEHEDVVIQLCGSSTVSSFASPAAPAEAKSLADTRPYGFVLVSQPRRDSREHHYFDAESPTALEAWIRAISREIQAASTTPLVTAFSPMRDRDAKAAAEQVQQQISALALEQMVKQSREAGAAIAEAKLLHVELARLKETNAQAAVDLEQSRSELSRLRAQAKRQEDQSRTRHQELEGEIARLRGALSAHRHGSSSTTCSSSIASLAVLSPIQVELPPEAKVETRRVEEEPRRWPVPREETKSGRTSLAARRASCAGVDFNEESLTTPGKAVDALRRSSTQLPVSPQNIVDTPPQWRRRQYGRGSVSLNEELEDKRSPKQVDLARTCDFELEDDIDSDTDMELHEQPKEVMTKRRVAYSAETFGAWNQYRQKTYPSNYHSHQERQAIIEALSNCEILFSNLLHHYPEYLDSVVDAMPIQEVPAGEYIIRTGEDGDSAYVLLSGRADVYKDPSSGPGLGTLLKSIPTSRVFGDLAMMWRFPRSRSIYAAEPCRLARLEREMYQALVVRREMEEREKREVLLQSISMFQTLGDEQIAQLADALERRLYEAGEAVVRQGEDGCEMFVLITGECEARIAEGKADCQDIQVHRRYVTGDIFGERALLKRTKRGATIVATSATELFCLNRMQVERMLGSMDKLQEQNYLADPRKIISDFYLDGGAHGPRGVYSDSSAPNGATSEWFAVYRPTSREAISKMLNGVAVGKGLNVKGKSAKKNRLSGFVPFLQISQNADKSGIESAEPDSRVTIFYGTINARDTALAMLKPLLKESGIKISGRREIAEVDSIKGVYGLDVPEPVLHEAYIMRPDISFLVGWETGRVSEPAFMDMNLHAVRGSSDPKVVLYQIDSEYPMNPHGLLIAYAEEHVKPVVSDFDTFTVGSRGMNYEALIPEQSDLAMWSLGHTADILAMPSASGWNSRWLGVLKDANEKGFHPNLPKYGFGDSVSYRLIEAAVKKTASTGAVRHGAECFNFYFPQELDEDYLVVWDGFTADTGKPWTYLDEDELRGWLLERVDDGYAFPLNPVWPVRDYGWYEVFKRLMENEETRPVMEQWFPARTGVLDKVAEMHEQFPDGFQKLAVDNSRGRMSTAFGDAAGAEQMDLMMEVARSKGWSRAKKKLMGGLGALTRGFGGMRTSLLQA